MCAQGNASVLTVYIPWAIVCFSVSASEMLSGSCSSQVGDAIVGGAWTSAGIPRLMIQFEPCTKAVRFSIQLALIDQFWPVMLIILVHANQLTSDWL